MSCLFENLFTVTEIQNGFLVENIPRLEKTFFDNNYTVKFQKQTCPL